MYIGRRELLVAGGSLLLPAAPASAQATGIGGAIGGAAAIVRPGGIAGLILAGRTRIDAGRALAPADRWHIGSNTKAMTAALYARLVEQGRARWDASVADLFPDLRVRRAWSAVTIRQLMGHAAGLTDAAIDTAWLIARHNDPRPVRAQRAEFAKLVLSRPPQGTPGRFAYGNAGYLLLGAAIEAATGQDWEAVVATELFAPLAMRSAGFGAPSAGGPWGHAEGPGGPVPLDPANIADNPAILGPAGRVHLALGDYAGFLSLYLRGGAPLLKPTTLDALLTPPEGSRYAGGWSLGERSGQGAALMHEGSNTFWHAIAVVAPARDVAYAAIVNQGGARGRDAALDLLAQVRASTTERERTPAS